MSRLIETITYYEHMALNNNSTSNLRKRQHVAYSLDDLVYVFNLLRKACLIRIIKTCREDALPLRFEDLLHRVKKSTGAYSTNNYIKRQDYSIRIAQLDGYYITENHTQKEYQAESD